MRKLQRALVLASLLGGACVKSDRVECLPGYGECAGVCVATLRDPAHCGACGRACAVYEVCAAGQCVATCESSLRAPLTDPWGAAWDGIERPAATFRAARAACAAIGGRLPSATELFRVSATKTGAVGDGTKTNPIWSITPDGPSDAFAVKLADGAASSLATRELQPYRCVCPPARPAAFSGGACNGPAAAECAAMPDDVRFNVDAEDRPALSKAGAITECAFAGGDLPSAERLAAAAAHGLPHGSGVGLHTAEDTGHVVRLAVNEEEEALVSFSGTSPSVATGPVEVLRPFRCYGPAALDAVPASVAVGFREPRGDRIIDAGPENVATTYTAAVSDCRRKGGHLPTATELAAMAAQGLPASASAGPLLTADQGPSGRAITFAWSGTAYWPVDPELAATGPTVDGVPYLWSASLSNLDNADANGRPYRCVYYPVDPAYPGPTSAQCSGCVPFPETAASPRQPRMWFNPADEGAATDTWASAVAACARKGGRLASVRDLLEAIRSTPGLSGDGNNTVLTSDLVAPLAARTLKWNGTSNEGFSDSGSAVGTAALTATGVRFRCMWTNEIR